MTALNPQTTRAYPCASGRVRASPRARHWAACEYLTGLSRYPNNIGHDAALSDMGYEPFLNPDWRQGATNNAS
jgi:hypothetical protein